MNRIIVSDTTTSRDDSAGSSTALRNNTEKSDTAKSNTARSSSARSIARDRSSIERVSRGVALLLAALVLSFPAHGGMEDTDDLSALSLSELLDIVVTTVSQKSEEIWDSPSNVTVITAKQLHEWGSRDLKDAIRRVPGFQVIADRDEWVFAARGNISDNNSKYLILIDGHRMNSFENFGPGQIIEMPNDLSNVKRLEIIRGPGSSVWGGDALAGVINIVTLDAEDLGEQGRRVSVTIGQDDTLKGNFQFGTQVAEGAASILLAGSVGLSGGTEITQSSPTLLPILDTTSGFSTHPFGTHTTLLDQHEPGYMLQLKARVGAFRINAFTFNTETFNRHFETGRGRENFLVTDKSFIEGIWSRAYDSGMNLEWRISADSNRAEYLPKKGTALNLVWLDRRFNSSFQLQKPLSQNIDLSLGVDYSFTKLGPNPRINNLNLEDPQDRQEGFLFDEYVEDNSIGGYSQFDITLSEQVKLTVGGRLDFSTDRGEDDLVFNPRVGLIWRADENKALKILYNRGFLRPANFQATSPGIEAETMDQVDVVWLQDLGKTSLSTTAYWQRLSGFISIISIADSTQFANTGDYESKGLEVALTRPLGNRHDLWANLSYSDAEAGNFPAGLSLNARRIKPDGTLLSFAPLTVNTGATLRFGENFFISPALRFVSETDYRATPPTADINDAIYEKTDAFAFIDINLSYELNDSVELSLYVDNLLDVDDPTHLSIWNGTLDQYGRYAEAKVRFRF